MERGATGKSRRRAVPTLNTHDGYTKSGHIFAIIIGSTHAAGSSMPYMNTPALRDCRQGHTVPRTAKLGRGWG